MGSKQPPKNRSKKAPTPPEDSLEELTAQNAETMARARKEVERAKATSHDQILAVGPRDKDHGK